MPSGDDDDVGQGAGAVVAPRAGEAAVENAK